MSREHIHLPKSLGEHAADVVVAGMGSWRFVIVQTIFVVLWVLANAWFLTHPFDPEPFIALNLIFSIQAAYASPLILMASNRQASKDRARDSLEADEVEALYHINQEQLEILHLLRGLVKEEGQS